MSSAGLRTVLVVRLEVCPWLGSQFSDLRAIGMPWRTRKEGGVVPEQNGRCSSGQSSAAPGDATIPADGSRVGPDDQDSRRLTCS